MKSLLTTGLLLCLPSLAFSQVPDHPAVPPAVSRQSVNLSDLSITPLDMDTCLPGSYIHHPLYLSDITWSELGNPGLPALPNLYRPLRNALSPLMAEGYDAYGKPAGDLTFYRSASPFSMVNYNSGGAQDKNGQTIRGLFARDLKRDGNITVYGLYINSDGHFKNQKSNASTVNANYRLSREHYSLTAGLARKKFNSAENGGLTSDESLIGNSYPDLIAVNLSKATSNTTDLAIEGTQSFRFTPRKSSPPPADSLAPPDTLPVSLPERKTVRIDHQFLITDFLRKYTDDSPPDGFYPLAPDNLERINDSIRFSTWTNVISYLPDTLKIKDKTFRLKAGIRPDLFRYQYADTVQWGMRIGLGGELVYQGAGSRMTARGSWVAAGYSAGDYQASLTFDKIFRRGEKESELELLLCATGAGPDPMIRDYRSAAYSWHNPFLRQHETALQVTYRMTPLKIDVSVSGYLNANRIYFNADAVPAQLGDPMVTGTFRVSKRFSAGAFRSTVTLLAQHSSSGIIRLPLLTGCTSTYMHHDIRFASTGGSIEVEYGLDLRYSTPFKGYSYMPATGLFHLRDDFTTGNYPYLNLFAMMKVKRTRLFAGWFHTLSGLLASQSFPVEHYPFMKPHFKYGIYWHFYD